jgi:hypothetical protein
MHGGRRREPQWNTQGQDIPRIFACGADPAGAKGACDRRDNAATDGALRDGNHQRNQWKHRGDTGKAIYARSRYEIDLEQRDKNLDGHDGGIGDRKPQDHGRDWLLQQHPGAGVHFSGSSRTLTACFAAPAALDGGRGDSFGKFGARLPAAVFRSRKRAALTG